MNYIKKTLLLVAILMLLIPCVCKAESASASNQQTLEEAITKVNNGEIDTISLTESIVVTGPLTEIKKDVTVEGNGFTISGDENWYTNGGKGNQSIITSTDGTLTLKNLILKHGPKQGAQAYGKGTLVLDGVTISDFKYSGLIANGGTIIVKDLNLNTTVGIEVGKSATNPEENTPKILMDGNLKTTSQALLYEDPDTKSKLTIENEEDSSYKLFVTENSVFITDNNNTVIYEAKNSSSIDIENSDMAEENFVTVTINYNEKTKKIVVTKNETLSKYDLDDVKNIEGKVFVNFVGENEEVFSEDTKITEDIELTAVYKDESVQDTNTTQNETTNKVDETPTQKEEPNTPKNEVPIQKEDNQKDNTPKTGNFDYLGIVLVITVSISALLIVTLRKKLR